MSVSKFNLSQSSKPESNLSRYPQQRAASFVALMFFIVMAPLTVIIPSHANPDNMSEIHSQSTVQTDVTQGKANTTTPPCLNIGKHLYTAGKLGTMVCLAILASEMQPKISRYRRYSCHIAFHDYHILFSAVPTMMGLGKSIADDCKPPKFQQKSNTASPVGNIISTLYALGKTNALYCSVLVLLKSLEGKSSRGVLLSDTNRLINTLISLGITGGFGKSLYDDYKAYKQRTLLHTTTDQHSDSTVQPKATTTHI